MSGSRNSRKGVRHGRNKDEKKGSKDQKNSTRTERRGFVAHATATNTTNAYGPRDRYVWDNMP